MAFVLGMSQITSIQGIVNMTKRRRGEVFVGMRIEHMYRREMNSPEFDWYCTIEEINEAKNELKVSITNTGSCQSHPETWNMVHTVNGLIAREYLEVGEDDAR